MMIKCSNDNDDDDDFLATLMRGPSVYYGTPLILNHSKFFFWLEFENHQF